MAAVLAGEAAVRIVPTLRNFHSEVRRGLKAQPHSLEVEVKPQLAKADAELAAWRARQSSNAVNVPVRADFQSFQRDLSQVEHIFKRSSVAKAIRVNVAVAGLDALPALAYAAGSAAAAVDALGKAAFALPGLLGGALASAGALATGLHGVSDALKAYSQDSDKATENARKHQDADRELTSAKRNLQNAIRDQKREMEDLNHEMRRSSLSEADAILSIQEDVERLNKGGFRSITEFQRAQLQLLQDTDHLSEVRTKNNRTIEDANKANAEGVLQSDKVSDALDRVAKATEGLNESGISKVSDALAKLSPNAQSTVQALHALQGEWTKLVQTPTQDALFAGMDKSLTDLAHKTLPMLGSGLSGVASGLNTNLKAITSSLGADKNSSLLTKLFGNTQGGLNNASKGMDSMIHGILQLTATSSNALPRLGDAATKVFGKFDSFIGRISQDGTMERWIDKGLKAVDSLGRTVGSIGSVISSVSQAFDTASGHTGGFLTNLDHAAKKLADFLKSAQGQSTLVGYFKQAQEFTKNLADAFRDAKPFLHDLVTAAREWSSTLLPIIGELASVAAWVERNTGLVKPLLEAYLSFQTVRPVIEGLTGMWSNYTKIMGAVERQGGVGGAVQNGFQELKNKMYAVGQAADTTKGKVSSASGEIESLGNTAGTAAGKVEEGKAGSLGGALKNLGKFIGPGLAFTAAIVGVTTLIEQLGKAHEEAANQAREQESALKSLNGTLDQSSGAVTRQTMQQTAQGLQGFSIPGIGKRNILEDIARTGAATPEQFLQATNPVNQQQRTDLIAQLDKKTEDAISRSDEWKRFSGEWQGHGIDLTTLSKAANGDEESLGKVRAAQSKMEQEGHVGTGTFGQINRAAEHAAGLLPGDLTQVLQSAGVPDSATSAIALRGTSQSFVTGGAGIQAANRAAFGKGKLTPEGLRRYSPFGTDDSKVYINAQGDAVIEMDRQPTVAPEDGQATPLAGNRWQVVLSADATKRDIQKLSTGGLVRGVGGPTDDLNLAAMSPGEHVTKAKAVDYYGVGFFNALNNMQIPKHGIGGWSGWAPPPTPVHDVAKWPAPPAPQPKPIVPIPGGLPGLPGPPSTLPEAIGRPVPHPLGTVNSGLDAAGRYFGGVGSWINRNISSPNMSVTPDNTGGSKFSGWGRSGTVAGLGLTGKVGKGDSAEEQLKNVTPVPLPNLPRPATPPPSSSARPQSSSRYDYRDLVGARWVPNQGWVKPDGSPVLEGGSGAPSVPLGGGNTHGSGGLPGPQNHLPAIPGLPGTGGGNVPLTTAGAVVPGMIYPPTAGIPGMPLTGSRFPGTEKGLQVNTLKSLQAISAAFPEIGDIGGVRPDKLHWHPDGLALDIMIPGQGGLNDPTTPEGLALGNRIWAWMGQNAEALGIDMNASLWQQPDHHNHIHLATTGGGYPTGGEQFTMPGLPGAAGLPGGAGGAGVLDALGIPGLGGTGGGGKGDTVNSSNYLQPKNIFDFFTKQASSIGAGASQIGLGLLQGATGLNLSSLLGTGQELGNGLISAYGGQGGASGDGTELNAAAADDMSRYINGQLPLGASGAGGVGSPYSPSGGAEQWRPLVRKVLQQVGPQYGISNTKAWEDAIIKQIGTESGGNPNSTNDHDSNGRGGTQSVGGILNFLPSTFGANNITGGSFMDPQAQIAAAIPYVVKKFGMNPDGSPKGIGLGHGFKSGGFPPGSAMVSSGEFITNNKATSFYGPALFNALNSMSIPKKSIGGFKNGGFPRGIPRFEDGGYPIPPVDFGQPAPAPLTPQPPQTPGPLQLGQPSMEAPASTGGPPGPGATAPAPDPGGLPQVADALAGLGGGAPGQSDLPQPGADDTAAGDDARATLGARPASMEHTAPAISQGIAGAASTIGSIASMAASMAINGVAPGAGSAAGAGIQAGAQMAGSIATGAVNILSSLLVGTATPGSTAQASGIPLLPKRQDMQTGVPAINQRIHQGDVNVTNLDQYKRQNELMDAQNMMPRIGQYG